MSNMLVHQYQSRILGPDEPVDYTSIIKAVYPPEAIQHEPFVGFKVLCTDTQAFMGDPRQRMAYLDTQIGFIRNKGVIIRETNTNKPDGLWVISLPVPRSQITLALNNLFDVLRTLENYYGIVCDGLFDICTSGRCPMSEVERSFQGIIIPQDYMACLIPTNNIMCSIGQIQRINDMFMCLRTRWDLKSKANNNQNAYFEGLALLAQLLTSMYH
jgi:hypothetical protein